ncbi:MAG: diphosphomevalonate decarboxylase [Candidatus Sericytochromatia bacterium]|nr:diphosphomevalonate decarboxylase [Candidatus Sericytochromatia bacterium]
MTRKASAEACANIALIKYWGKRDAERHLPCNGSISLALADLRTVTTVAIDPSLTADTLALDGHPASAAELGRLGKVLRPLRERAGETACVRVESVNYFPTAAGLASSAAGFAALALAAAAAYDLTLDEPELSRLARIGSGSACRSVPGGWAEWHAGTDPAGLDSFATRLAPPDHWDLRVMVGLVATGPKAVGSGAGMAGTVATSPFYAGWLQGVAEDLPVARAAILARDFDTLGEAAERSCLRMHGSMLGAVPPLLYWQPATIAVMQAVWQWRQEGLPCFFTIDAGPNVKVFCPAAVAADVERRMKFIPGVTGVRASGPGQGVALSKAHLF